MTNILDIPLTQITESPDNPRRTFKNLEELAANIKLNGVLQPVMVRGLMVDDGKITSYELVFGARRTRATAVTTSSPWIWADWKAVRCTTQYRRSSTPVPSTASATSSTSDAI